MDAKPNFIMTVGLPASGKTAWADQYKDQGYHVHSSDKIRAELLGDENAQTDNQRVFSELHKRVKEDLAAGISCIYDATNMSRKRRKVLLDELKNIPCYKECALFPAPIEECKARNQSRERQVPDDVYDKTLRSFWVPYYYEGWDNIGIVNFSSRFHPFNLYEMVGFSQDNPHHSLDLFDHCVQACLFASHSDFSSPVIEAAQFHDIGKLYTKSFKDANGNDSDVAHYYGHESYGAYLYLVSELSDANNRNEKRIDELLYIAALINWHMRPYTAWRQSKQCEAKDRELIGEAMYQDILDLHKADAAAH